MLEINYRNIQSYYSTDDQILLVKRLIPMCTNNHLCEFILNKTIEELKKHLSKREASNIIYCIENSIPFKLVDYTTIDNNSYITNIKNRNQTEEDLQGDWWDMLFSINTETTNK